MYTKVMSTKLLKPVCGWEIEKSIEQRFNAFDEPQGRPTVFYACVNDDTIVDTFDTLAKAQEFCREHKLNKEDTTMKNSKTAAPATITAATAEHAAPVTCCSHCYDIRKSDSRRQRAPKTEPAKSAPAISEAAAKKALRDRIKALGLQKAGKYDRDRAIWDDIKSRGEYTHTDFLCMVSILQAPYHDSGKIEGLQSIDSTSSCEFCARMRAAAGKDPRIICGYCYDHAQETGYRGGNVRRRHQLQAELLSTVEIPAEYLALVPLTTFAVRFNSSGDLVNHIHYVNYMRIAATHPEIMFTLWYKNKAAVLIGKKRQPRPANVILIESDPLIDGDGKPCSEDADLKFRVLHEEHISAAIAAGCGDCNGKKCRVCGYRCYKTAERGGWEKGTIIAEKLRDK